MPKNRFRILNPNFDTPVKEPHLVALGHVCQVLGFDKKCTASLHGKSCVISGGSAVRQVDRTQIISVRTALLIRFNGKFYGELDFEDNK